MGDSPGGSGVAWVVVTVVQAPEASDAVTVVVMVGMLKRLEGGKWPPQRIINRPCCVLRNTFIQTTHPTTQTHKPTWASFVTSTLVSAPPLPAPRVPTVPEHPCGQSLQGAAPGMPADPPRATRTRAMPA